MPLRYVNPAPARKSKTRKRPQPAGLARWQAARASAKRKRPGPTKKQRATMTDLHSAFTGRRSGYTRLVNRNKRRRAARKAATPTRNAAPAARTTPKRRKTAMKKRKRLYGAAAAAHAKRVGRRSKKRRGSGRARKSSVRARAGRKAARTRAANKTARRAAARKGARKRRTSGRRRHARRVTRKRSRYRRNPGTRKGARKAAHTRASRRLSAEHAPRRRRRRSKARRVIRRRRRRHGGGGRAGTPRSLRRARRAIRNRRKTPLGRAYARRYHMRSNPSFGDVMSLFKSMVPVAVGLYGSRILSSASIAAQVPGVNALPAQYQRGAMSLVAAGLTHFATKHVKMLQPHRGPAMIGAALNVFEQVVLMLMPPSVSQLLGLSDYVAVGSDVLHQGLSDYLSVGATPIDDNITLSDYLEVGSLQQELGLSEELGLEEELGDDLSSAAGPMGPTTAPMSSCGPQPGTTSLDRSYLGGVSQSSMLAPVQNQPLLAPVPARSFTQKITGRGASYDNSDRVYTGIFNGGF